MSVGAASSRPCPAAATTGAPNTTHLLPRRHVGMPPYGETLGGTTEPDACVQRLRWRGVTAPKVFSRLSACAEGASAPPPLCGGTPLRHASRATSPQGEALDGANRDPVSGGHTGRPYGKTESGSVGADFISARPRRRVGCTLAERVHRPAWYRQQKHHRRTLPAPIPERAGGCLIK